MSLIWPNCTFALLSYFLSLFPFFINSSFLPPSLSIFLFLSFLLHFSPIRSSLHLCTLPFSLLPIFTMSLIFLFFLAPPVFSFPFSFYSQFYCLFLSYILILPLPSIVLYPILLLFPSLPPLPSFVSLPLSPAPSLSPFSYHFYYISPGFLSLPTSLSHIYHSTPRPLLPPPCSRFTMGATVRWKGEGVGG